MDKHIDTYIGFFLTSRQAAGRSPKTVQSYRWHLDVFRSWAEEEGLTDITTIAIEDLERFIVFLRSRDTLFTNHPKRSEEKRPLSAATIYGTVRALKTFFKFLAQRRYLASDPAAGLVMPKKPKKLRPTIPLKAVESMLAAAQRGPCPTRDRALMLLLLDTGPRVSELCRPDIKDLDLEEGKMTILNGKGEKDRVVSITPRVISALAELVDDRPRQEPIFVNSRTGRRLTPEGINKILYRTRDLAGLDGTRVNAHTWRHTFASRAAGRNGNVFALQEVMGYEDIATTKLYVHPDFEEIKAWHTEASPVNELDAGL